MVARATVAADSVATVAETDLPVIIADIRAATAECGRWSTRSARRSGRRVGQYRRAQPSKGLQALDQVTETFGNANETLAPSTARWSPARARWKLPKAPSPARTA